MTARTQSIGELVVMGGISLTSLVGWLKPLFVGGLLAAALFGLAERRSRSLQAADETRRFLWEVRAIALMVVTVCWYAFTYYVVAAQGAA